MNRSIIDFQRSQLVYIVQPITATLFLLKPRYSISDVTLDGLGLIRDNIPLIRPEHQMPLNQLKQLFRFLSAENLFR